MYLNFMMKLEQPNMAHRITTMNSTGKIRRAILVNLLEPLVAGYKPKYIKTCLVVNIGSIFAF